MVATQAPAMAPQVDARQVPVLDAKVDEFLGALDGAEAKSPTFTAQADAVRSMGDTDIRKAAETSNRLLNAPVRALEEGGLSEGSKVGQTLLQLRRAPSKTSTPARPGGQEVSRRPFRSATR